MDEESVFRLSERSHPYGKERNAEDQDFESFHAFSCGSDEFPKACDHFLKDIPRICKRPDAAREAARDERPAKGESFGAS